MPPIIKIVTTDSPTEPIDKKNTGTGNQEVNTATPLNYGALNIDADAWSQVKVVWGHVTDMGGATTISNLKFYVDGDFAGQTTISHYDLIQQPWINPASISGKQTGNSLSGKTYAAAKPLLKDDGSATLTAIDQFTEYLFCQLFVSAGTPTGSHTTGEGSGRAKIAFTYS